MKNIKRSLWAYLLLLTVAWWLTERPDFSALSGLFAWRNVLNQYSGVLGIGVMSLAMILAVRPAFLEGPLGGLDKMYRLHKWLGISGLIISVTHWIIAKGPKWLVDLGWLERRGRPPRPALPEGSLQQWFMGQRGLAENIGEWAFYGALLLMVLALIQRFPYRRFFQTHRFLAVAYLALVFHGVILLKFDDWSGPIGVLMALLMAAGSVSAVLVLARRRLGGQRAAGKVVVVEPLPLMDALAVEIQLQGPWVGHQAGQFVFITFHYDEGPHPFTIASAWAGDGRLRFLIKALGDYTRSLPGRLKVGDPVTLEGPYGRFDFQGKAPRQIWIGGGIGITPFMARLQALAKAGDGKQIDLFHSTANYDPAAMEQLTRQAETAGVRLHVLWDQRDGRLDVARLIGTVPEWREADVWFCGPSRFGEVIRTGLVSQGFSPQHFHQELFAMR